MSTKEGGVVVDVLAISEEERLVAPIEGKSGANVDESQAAKYQAITPEDVARQLGLPFSHTDARAVPMFACVAEHAPRIRRGLSRACRQSALLVVGNGRAILEPDPSSTVAAFDVEIPIGDPPAIIPVDVESPEEEYLELLLPEIVAVASRGEEMVAVNTLLDRAVRHLSVYGRKARGDMRRRSEGALSRLFSAKEYKADFRLEPGGSEADGKIVRILRSPLHFDNRGQTQSWQRLQRGAGRVLRRPRGLPVSKRQLTFEDMAREADPEDDRS